MYGSSTQGNSADHPRILRVGLDLGFQNTVFQAAQGLGDLLVPRTHRFPTCLAYGNEAGGLAGEVHLGDEALHRRHETAVVRPLAANDPQVLGDFAQALRNAIDSQGAFEIWGVVSSPRGATAEDLHAIRTIAHEIFDRTRLMDGALLMATSFGSQEVARNSIWIDVGAGSVRVALVRGGTPEAGDTMVIEGGGAAINQRLRDGLARRFPDLALSDVSLNGIKERFGHVPPWEGECRLRIRYGEAEQVIDVASLVRRACEPVVDDVLEGLRRVVAACPSDAIDEFLAHIVVAGGGARMKGLAERLQAEARREFGSNAWVRIPEEPTALVANGALRWAHFLQDEEWGIPLFSFAP